MITRKFRVAATLLLCSVSMNLQPQPPAEEASAEEIIIDPIRDLVAKRIEEVQAAANPANPYDAIYPLGAKILRTEKNDRILLLVFNDRLAYRPLSPIDRDALIADLQQVLADQLTPGITLEVKLAYRNGRSEILEPLETHVTTAEAIRARAGQQSIPSNKLAAPVVDTKSYAGPERTLGLYGKNLVVGPSHGWTWHQEKRWQFQRARLFTMVEDVYPASYINPFLTPMLENAGATVFNVRERDHQTAESILDNDMLTPELPAPDSDVVLRDGVIRRTGNWAKIEGAGWKGGRPASIAPDDHPFLQGSTESATHNGTGEAASIVYTPYVPRTGRFAVYTSWRQAPENSPSVPVHVDHLGGRTTFHVNQQVAGGTWIFLGFFEFNKGVNPATGSVTITTEGASPASSDGAVTVSADAVRFGGGMGNIAPDGQISGKPRHTEAGHYFLQYSGAPKDLVTYRSTTPGAFGFDYWHDIIARPEWANFLNGAPNGPNGHRQHPGLGVPIEMYLSFHTDAGVDKTGVYGTLSLYRVFGEDNETTFPDGRSRWLNRDLTALMQEEIVRSTRTLYSSTWERRALQERNLGEARRANVPSTLLELLSHQNFNDMKYGLDPRYRFDMSRAIYKSIVRFIAASHGYTPTIQPLAPTHFSARIVEPGVAELNWQPQADPLEPTADADGYIVYTSKDGKSFDNGSWKSETTVRIVDIPEATSTWFRVTAANAGGESFPTTTLGVRWIAGEKPLLIVDGFDRVSGPAVVEDEKIRGFDRRKDPGVGWHYNHPLVGDMYDFNEDSEWADDLRDTGWGATDASMENRLEKGNTFDHAVVHGEAIALAGYSFDSTTAQAFDRFDRQLVSKYPLIDWIAGRQKAVLPYTGITETGTPDRMVPAFPVVTTEGALLLTEYLESGKGRLLISGSHIAAELRSGVFSSQDTRTLLYEGLGIRRAMDMYTTANSAQPWRMKNLTVPEPFDSLSPFRFGTDLDSTINLVPTVYPVPSGEAFDPRTARPLLSYGNNSGLAAVRTNRAITFGFPLETILPESQRNQVIAASLTLLLKENKGVD